MGGRQLGASQVDEGEDVGVTDRGFTDRYDLSDAAGSVPAHEPAAHTWVWLGLAVVVMAMFVVPVVVARPMDGDEGYYALASKLVAHGKTPYADFWFQQAPLLVYLYGLVVRVLGSSWSALRGASALLTVLLGGVIAVHGLRRWRSPPLAFLAATLFITTPLVFEWYPTVKTYALSTLLLFCAYVAADASSRRSWVLAGVLLGLAIDTRLLFATTIVVFALYAGRHILAFTTGLVAGLVPLLVFFVAGPSRFVNDAVMSQTTRSHASLTGNMTQKVHSLGGVLAEPHLLVLSLGAFAVLVASVREHRRVPFVVAIALTLGVTNLIPTPTYQQYFATLVPFLVIPTVDLVASWQWSNSRVAGIALIAVVVGALVPPGIVPASTSGVVPRNGLDPRETRAISSAIDARTKPDEEVLALWPGFLFESHAQPLPGLESDFVAKAVHDTHVSPERAQRFHMLSAEGIVGAIKAHRTRLIVVGEGDLSDTEPWRNIIQQSGYRPVERHQFATLYEYQAQSQSGR